MCGDLPFSDIKLNASCIYMFLQYSSDEKFLKIKAANMNVLCTVHRYLFIEPPPKVLLRGFFFNIKNYFYMFRMPTTSKISTNLNHMFRTTHV